VFERARRAAAEQEFAGKVIFREIDTSDRTGPPPPYEKIRKMIAKRARQVKSG